MIHRMPHLPGPDLVSLSGAAFSTLNTAAEALPPLEAHQPFSNALLTRLSGTNRRALQEALRVLEFIDEGDRVTPAFATYLEQPGRRPEIIRDRLYGLVPWAIPMLQGDGGRELLKELVQRGTGVLLAPRVARWLLDAAAFSGLREPHSRAQLPRLRRAATLPLTYTDEAPGPPSLVHLDPALVPWLQRLPVAGSTWSEDERELWLRTFSALLAGVYPSPRVGDR
jgi:hypothetical protein